MEEIRPGPSSGDTLVRIVREREGYKLTPHSPPAEC